jgi:chemotaxis protein methyltransferase CheR
VTEAPELTHREWKVLSDLIHGASGVRLGADKRELLASRLKPVLATVGASTFGRLVRAIQADTSGEILALVVDRATTNTTGFFRHRAQWDLLRTQLPELARARNKLRIWSAGCSSGEEPYSCALLLLGQGRVGDTRILATDVSRRALAKAKAAVYDADALDAVPPHRRQHFDPVERGRFALSAAARNLVTLRHHDLRAAARGAHDVFDVVLCRNVLIYFDAASRTAAVSRLVQVLRPGGILLLGPSEASVALPATFVRIGPAAYRKG